MTRRPSKTIVIDPRNVLPFAVAGIRNVHTAWRPTNRPVPASRAASCPTDARHAASLHDGARVGARGLEPEREGLPAAGFAGIVEKFRTSASPARVLTSYA